MAFSAEKNNFILQEKLEEQKKSHSSREIIRVSEKQRA